MIVSYRWLNEYLEIDISPQQMADKLTSIGLEANIVSQFPDFFEHVRIGEVLTVAPHPNADRLQVCQVNMGEGEPATIVCGAPNVAAGQKVPVATIGTTFPNGITIKKAKLRGVASNGMICSEHELDLSDDRSGIMVLDPAAEPGSNFEAYLSGGDVAIEIDLTPNRPDALGHLGVARDLAAALDTTFTLPKIDLKEGNQPAADEIKIRIEDPYGCPRYAARIVKGVQIGPSPRWLQQRLSAVGQRPINNVVDAANYVLMETGQPQHTFDMRYIQDSTIIVRKAEKGEKMVTLDSKERELDEETLLICDGQRPVALAGIMGGENSEVKDDTTDILIECAYFDPVTIRRGSKFLQLSTEASHRFERGVDPNGIPYALDRLAQLIRDLAGGEILKGQVDAYPCPIEPCQVDFRPARCNAVLGTDIEAGEMAAILRRLEMQVDEQDPTAWTVTVPTFRPDVEREIDLIEEVGRIYDYDRIPVPKHFRIGASKIQKPGPDQIRENVADHLAARGFYQTYSNSLVGAGDHPMVLGDEEPVLLANPLTQDMSTVRSSLLPNLEAIVRHNQNHRQLDLRLFEIGQVSSLDPSADSGARERTHLGIVLTGIECKKQWHQEEQVVTAYHLRGQIEELFQRCFRQSLEFEAGKHDLFRNALIIRHGDEVLGVMGELSSNRLDQSDLRGPVYYAELIMPTREVPQIPHFQKPAVFPTVERDLSILVPAQVAYQDIEAEIEKNGGKYLIYSRLYDLFEGKSIARDQKSLTFRLVFQNRERTLTEKEVDRDFNRVLKGLETAFNAKLREALT